MFLRHKENPSVIFLSRSISLIRFADTVLARLRDDLREHVARLKQKTALEGSFLIPIVQLFRKI